MRFGDLVYFEAPHVQHGPGLWRTDGTAEGTVFLHPFNSRFRMIDSVGTTVFLAANYGAHGWELWATDGTPQGTRLVKDLVPGYDTSAIPSAGAKSLGNHLYFSAYVDRKYGLWKTDGTADGTTFVTDLPGLVDSMLNHDGRLLFNTARQLWTSDGTAAGTARLSPDGVTLGTPQAATHLLVDGGDVYFLASDAAAGEELWKTDGTPAGTRRVADISPGPNGSRPISLRVVGDRLFLPSPPRSATSRSTCWTTASPAGGSGARTGRPTERSC